jgi:hypothetical protein
MSDEIEIDHILSRSIKNHHDVIVTEFDEKLLFSKITTAMNENDIDNIFSAYSNQYKEHDGTVSEDRHRRSDDFSRHQKRALTKTMMFACKADKVHLIEYLAKKENTKLAYSVALPLFCQMKHMNSIQWAFDQGADSFIEAMSAAGRSGSIDVVKLVRQNTSKFVWYFHAVIGACNYGHYDLFRWLVEQIQKDACEYFCWFIVIDVIIKCGHIEFLEYLTSTQNIVQWIKKCDVAKLLDHGYPVQRVRFLHPRYVDEHVENKNQKMKIVKDVLNNILCTDILSVLYSYFGYNNDIDYTDIDYTVFFNADNFPKFVPKN